MRVNKIGHCRKYRKKSSYWDKFEDTHPLVYFLHGEGWRSKRDGIPRFSKNYLSLEILKNQWKKQGGICNISGLKMHLKKNPRETKRIDQASLDRIDSSEGYTKDNIQFVCLAANFAKHTFSQKETEEFFDKIRNQK